MKNLLLLTAVLTLVPIHGGLLAQDPFRESKPGEEKPGDSGPMNLSICYEAFSVSLASAVKLQKENPSDPDLYAALSTALEKKEAKQEAFTIVRCKSGQKATGEAIVEQIYPTEYESPGLPTTLGVAVSTKPAKDDTPSALNANDLKNAPELSSLGGIATPSTPTAFETRNTGVTVEVEATAGEDGKFVDLRIVPDHTALVDESIFGQGLSKVQMPVFESQRINTAITTRTNKPALLGTINRSPASKLDTDSANRVWFAFVTVTVARP